MVPTPSRPARRRMLRASRPSRSSISSAAAATCSGERRAREPLVAVSGAAIRGTPYTVRYGVRWSGRCVVGRKLHGLAAATVLVVVTAAGGAGAATGKRADFDLGFS